MPFDIVEHNDVEKTRIEHELPLSFDLGQARAAREEMAAEYEEREYNPEQDLWRVWDKNGVQRSLWVAGR